jgi:intracellular septation protein
MSSPQPPSPLLKLLLDFGPLLLFFLVYGRSDLYTATAVLMVASAVSFGVLWRLERRMPVMPLVNVVLVSVFGGLTLWLADETFIKMKPTLIYALFALILAGGRLLGRQPLRVVFGPMMSLQEKGWTLLTWRWAAFFLFLAGVNEIAWRVLTTDQWVTLKTFGFIPIVMLFALTQAPLMTRYKLLEETDSPRS